MSEHTIEDLPPGYLTAVSTRVVITSPIASGDRIRVEYKGSYSKEWQWLRAGSVDITDEIIVSLQAEDIAKSLGMKYDKKRRQFSFTSTYDLTYEVLNGANVSKTGGVIEPNKTVTIDASAWFKGIYKFCFRRDAAEYVLTIQL